MLHGQKIWLLSKNSKISLYIKIIQTVGYRQEKVIDGKHRFLFGQNCMNWSLTIKNLKSNMLKFADVWKEW